MKQTVERFYELKSGVEDVNSGSVIEAVQYGDSAELRTAVHEAGFEHIIIPYGEQYIASPVDEYEDADLTIIGKFSENFDDALPFDVSDDIQQQLGGSEYTVVEINTTRYVGVWEN